MPSLVFANRSPTTETYTLSLHDALPIWADLPGATLYVTREMCAGCRKLATAAGIQRVVTPDGEERSEEHTSELQSREKLVCRLLLEKKKNSVTDTTEADATARALSAHRG